MNGTDTNPNRVGRNKSSQFKQPRMYLPELRRLVPAYAACNRTLAASATLGCRRSPRHETGEQFVKSPAAGLLAHSHLHHSIPAISNSCGKTWCMRSKCLSSTSSTASSAASIESADATTRRSSWSHTIHLPSYCCKISIGICSNVVSTPEESYDEYSTMNTMFLGGLGMNLKEQYVMPKTEAPATGGPRA